MEKVINKPLPKGIIKESYGVSGMTCASCAVSLESYLKNQPGISEVAVNYPNQSVTVHFDAEAISPDELKQAAREIGYEIITGHADEKQKAIEEAGQNRLITLRNKVIFSTVFSLPVFVMAMFLMGAVPYENWIMLILTTPVMFWSGSEFFINAWKKAMHFSTNMDTLVALSTGIAYLFSVFNTIYPTFFIRHGIPPHVYYESAVIIITLILLGRYLEEKAKSKTSSAIKKLMGLQPKQVTALRNGMEEVIPLDDVIKGDLLIVKPGNKIPVDGTVRKGASYVDESMISGEAIPVGKSKGDEVFAGTINQKGSLRILAKKVGSETLLSQIIEMVQNAQASKPPIQKLVDKIAGVFVPLVILIALLAFAIWYFIGPEPNVTYAFLILITVLIIACPCALGLATPTALMVGIGKGAQKGILIKDAQTLEVAYKTNAVVLDKTGTITKGHPEVTDMIWQNNDELHSSILLAIESQSEHPIAEAIVRKLKTSDIRQVQVEMFESLTGLGAKAKYNNRWFYVGNEKLLTSQRIIPDEEVVNRSAALRQQAKTVVYFADEHQVKGLIAVADQVKNSSALAIKRLKQSGVEVYMLTGDNKETAAAIARQVHIDRYRANVLPTDKGNFVKELQAEGKIVAMVGDGINDSHALAQADIGIAMGSGTDIAMQSAGITLMHSDLQQISRAIMLSKATIRTVRQNLFWAFIYNIIAIPIAAGALYPALGFLLNPMIAGAAMAMSSVSVVGNSLRLKRIQLK